MNIAIHYLRLLIIIFFCLSCHVASCQKYVESVQLYDVIKKEFYNTKQLMGSKGLVLVFYGLDCPFSLQYEDKIRALRSVYEPKGVNFVLVDANDPSVGQKVTISRMRKKATELNMAYMSDQSQAAMSALRVSKNGEVVVITVFEDSYKVFYRGSIDNNPLTPDMADDDYLRASLDNLVAGKSAAPFRNTRANGCRIR